MCSFGSCKTRFEFLSQFRTQVRNAFECFVTQVQTHAVAKNQTRLAYEDKCDLYFNYSPSVGFIIGLSDYWVYQCWTIGLSDNLVGQILVTLWGLGAPVHLIIFIAISLLISMASI